MADYYQTSRDHVRSLKLMSDSAARRAERRTELAGISAEQPVNLLRVDARPVKLVRNTEQYRAVESMEGLVPWNSNHDNMIDRFDGRALLDFYKDPVPRRQKKTEDELQLEELVAFESYRDLVRLLQKGLEDAAGIRAAEEENIELRAQARTDAAAAAGVPVSNTRPAPSFPAGAGAYGAVGFAYDTTTAADGDASGSEGDSSEDDSDDERPRELGEEEVDNLAANLGIDSFSAMLRRAEKQEADFAAGNVKHAKRMFSRKKAAQRAKRMAGMGLEAFPKETIKPGTHTALAAATRERVERARELSRRRSPSYDGYGSRSRSRSGSPRRRREERPKTQFITSFSDLKPSHRERDQERPRHGRGDYDEPSASHRGEGNFLDALPTKVDPSTDGGPVSLPASAVVMHGRRANEWEPRSRYGRDRDDRHSRESKRKEAPAATPATKAAGAKETPMERLKRLRAAQLNKTFQKDMLSTAQKRVNEERDRNARLQIERIAVERRRSPSPRYRERHEDDPNRYSVSPDYRN